MGMKGKGLKFFEKAVDRFIAWMMVIMLLLILVNVFLRQVGGTPVFWVEEVVRLIFIWICASGITSGIFSNDHMKLEFFNRFPGIAVLLRRVSWLLFSVFFGIIAYSGMLMVKTNIEMGRTLKTLPNLPFWVFSAVLPVFFLLSVWITFIIFLKEE
jgi:TRAP-type C4-dicarboxylate transport system permease small subunit